MRWSRAIVAADTALGKARALPALFALTRMLRRAVRDQRQRGREGLVGLLVEARDDEGKLSEDELVAMLFLLTIAGFETTVHLIGNGWLALQQHPDQLEAWRADPGLGEAAVEELLRVATPLETTTERYALEDLELGGVSIRRGEMVLVAIVSANRDESVFPSPDTLDLRRADNPHLSFGLGNHFCLGARLARLEVRLAFEALFVQARGLRLDVDAASLAWRRGAVTRGLRALPVRIAKEPGTMTPTRTGVLT